MMDNSWSKFLSAVSKFCFYSAIFVLPLRIDSWLFNAEFFNGFLSPYSMHFLYLVDILLLLGGVFLALGLVFNSKVRSDFCKLSLPHGRIFWAFVLLLCLYFISIFWSYSPLNSLVYALRFLEFFLFYLLVVSGFLKLRVWTALFIGMMIFQSLIGFLQFWIQGSLGLGVLGEPLFGLSELGVAKVTIFGIKFVRIYGTFTHPNVFAAFLVMSILLLLTSVKVKRYLLIVALAILGGALLLTFSRSAFLALAVALFVYFYGKNRRRAVLVALPLLLLFGLALVYGDHSSFEERMLYLDIADDLLLHNSFGVGAGNFTAVMQDYSDLKLVPWLLQPVHNLFVLFAAELGLPGLSALLFILLSLFRVAGKKRLDVAVFLSAFITLALFDHYFATLYQGQALFWLFMILGSRL